MNLKSHLSAEAALSLVNIGLLLVSAFYWRSTSDGPASCSLRVKIGYLGTSLALCSQILCCLMLATWRYGWIPIEPGGNSLLRLNGRLANLGGLLSMAACLMALFERGLRRYASAWVGATTLYFWSMVGLNVSLSVLFR